MVFGKCVLKLVDQYSFLVLTVIFQCKSLPFFVIFLSIQFSFFLGLNPCFCVLFQTTGELICPAYHELCSVNPILTSGQCPNSCNSNGDCVDGKCHCFIGFDGHDCSKRNYPFSLFVHL